MEKIEKKPIVPAGELTHLSTGAELKVGEGFYLVQSPELLARQEKYRAATEALRGVDSPLKA